ncbi:hypothetical protein HH212_11055 [Massilia forsythiae]|uniref:Uncharacterized protein n=1 Tax=Massilia forsythiae TaxID=2728020 RepID=A0A7Z2ZSH7_9BURK|nr:hypothetical protein [Massilia forsythiae]QJE00491.1 hypothetical protein HH212_11055 [Massilia forsythiae]
MKSVTFSEIECLQDKAPHLSTLLAPRRLAQLALLIALGVPALVIAFYLLHPTAPLGYLVVPVLLAGALPLAPVLPGRLEVTTRFDACHMVGTLDATLGQMGYTQAERKPGSVLYRARAPYWSHWRSKEIVVKVRRHTLEVSGPETTLRALRRQMLP